MPRITEPATMLTDYLLAIVAGIGACMLFMRAAGSAAIGSWGVAFVATALASVTGGTVHGFTEYLGERHTRRLWIVTLAMVAVASAALLAAAGFAWHPPARVARYGPADDWAIGIRLGAPAWALLSLAALKLATVLVLIARRSEFRFVLADHALSLLIVLAAIVVLATRRAAPSLPWIAGGVAMTALGGLVQWRELAPHHRFNHNDLFHVIQLVSLLLFLRGGLLLDA